MPCVNEKMLQPATYAVRCIWPFSDAADRYSA
jgi:hypothetical protein